MSNSQAFVRGTTLRDRLVRILLLLIAMLFTAAHSVAQQPASKGVTAEQAGTEAELKNFFQSKIKTEWDALKHKDIFFLEVFNE